MLLVNKVNKLDPSAGNSHVANILSAKVSRYQRLFQVLPVIRAIHWQGTTSC